MFVIAFLQTSKHLLFYFFLTLQYCIGFAIYQNESATGIHVFLILNPPPSSLPIPSLWVVPVHQPQASREDFLMSPCQSLKLCIQLGLFSSFLSFLFSQLFVRPPQITILPSCFTFPWGWFWSLSPTECYEPVSILLQTLYQI